MTKCGVLLPAVLSLCFLALPAHAQGQPAVELPQEIPTGNGFTLHLPADWHLAPEEILERFNAAVPPSPDGLPVIAYVLMPDTTVQHAVPLMVFIQIERTGQRPEPTAQDLEFMRRQMNQGVQDAVRQTSAQADLTIKQPSYDAANRTIWAESAGQAAPAGPIRQLTASRLTSEGAINVICTATAAEYSRFEPLFRRIVLGIELSERLQYRPGASPARRASESREYTFGRRMGRVAAALLLLALVISLVRYLGKVSQRPAKSGAPSAAATTGEPPQDKSAS